MRPGPRVVPTLVSAAVALVVAAVLFTSVLFALALVAPFVGVWLALGRARSAIGLWRSDGRLPVGNALHIIEPERARKLALADFASAAGVVVASMVPTLWVFVSFPAAVAAGVTSVAGLSALATVRRRLVAGATPVEVLPPEEHGPFDP